ncbi:hypothetical protein [Mycoplasma yeatsii]|uniref:hypothetical protein n=1 Tax=Mycoplasma yeatsii TaxID=51365 RepID=UPI0005B24715|nr:hypothetical protein [Mycoplasma yeatsii]AJM72104.1 hypothetical protein MYE_03300 [Mycoplasma yeatsii GM274B]
MNIVHKEIEVSNRQIIAKPDYCCDVIFSKKKYQIKNDEFYKLNLIISKNYKTKRNLDFISNTLNNFKYKIGYKLDNQEIELFNNFKNPIKYRVSDDKKEFIEILLPVKVFNKDVIDLIFSCEFEADHKVQKFTSDIKLNTLASDSKDIYQNNLINYYKNYDKYSGKTNTTFNLLNYQLKYIINKFTVNKIYDKLMKFNYAFKVNLDRELNNNSEVNKLINDVMSQQVRNYFKIENLKLNDHVKANKEYKQLPELSIGHDAVYFVNKLETNSDKDLVIENNNQARGFIFNPEVTNKLAFDFKIFNDTFSVQTKVKDIDIIRVNQMKIKNPTIQHYEFSKEFFSSLNLIEDEKLEREIDKYEVE